MIASVFFHARLETIRPVSDSMRGDGIEQVLVQRSAMDAASFGCLKLNQRLKCFQGLDALP